MVVSWWFRVFLVRPLSVGVRFCRGLGHCGMVPYGEKWHFRCTFYVDCMLSHVHFVLSMLHFRHIGFWKRGFNGHFFPHRITVPYGEKRHNHHKMT